MQFIELGIYDFYVWSEHIINIQQMSDISSLWYNRELV